MKTERRLSHLGSAYRRPVAAARNVPIIVLITLLVLFAFGPALHAQEAPVGLGTAGDFSVLAASTVTNTGPTVLAQNLGVSPGNTATGFPPGTVLGSTHLADAVALQAQNDLTTAYNDAAGRTPFTNLPAELGGTELLPGVYRIGAAQLTGELTLDGQDNPNAVFIFQIDSTLTTATDSSISLVNEAQACNVFWQVSSSATLGVGTEFVGSVLALESITANTGATVEGRLLARTAAVTLDTNTITEAVCTAAAPEDTTTTTTQEDTTTTTTTTAPGDTTATTAPGDTTATTTPGDTTATTVAPPVGGVDTGGGSTSGAPNMILLLGGLSLLAAATGAFLVRRRLQDGRSG